jgi:hypothetical protein
MNKYQLTLVLTSKESNQCVAMPSCENGDSNSIIVRLNYCTSSLPGVGTRVGVRSDGSFWIFFLVAAQLQTGRAVFQAPCKEGWPGVPTALFIRCVSYLKKRKILT